MTSPKVTTRGVVLHRGGRAAEIPPVGTNFNPAKGAAIASSIDTPPRASAGKTFKVERPYSIAIRISVGVATPGITATAVRWHHSTTGRDNPGDTIKRPPALTAGWAWSGWITVTAPSSRSG